MSEYKIRKFTAAQRRVVIDLNKFYRGNAVITGGFMDANRKSRDVDFCLFTGNINVKGIINVLKNVGFYAIEAFEIHPYYMDTKEPFPSHAVMRARHDAFAGLTCDVLIKMAPVRRVIETFPVSLQQIAFGVDGIMTTKLFDMSIERRSIYIAHWCPEMYKEKYKNYYPLFEVF